MNNVMKRMKKQLLNNRNDKVESVTDLFIDMVDGLSIDEIQSLTTLLNSFNDTKSTHGVMHNLINESKGVYVTLEDAHELGDKINALDKRNPKNNRTAENIRKVAAGIHAVVRYKNTGEFS